MAILLVRLGSKRSSGEGLRIGTVRRLAALSRDTDFSVGGYCEDESRCHRSVLRRLLKERGANIVR